MMTEYRTKRWSVVCKLVQWSNNTSIHKAINDIPYRSLTGQNPVVGISRLPLSPNLMDELFTEAALVESFGVSGNQRLDEATVPLSSYGDDGGGKMSPEEAAQHHLTAVDNEVSKVRAQLMKLQSMRDTAAVKLQSIRDTAQLAVAAAALGERVLF